MQLHIPEGFETSDALLSEPKFQRVFSSSYRLTDRVVQFMPKFKLFIHGSSESDVR